MKSSSLLLLRVANVMIFITTLITLISIWLVYGADEKLTMFQLIIGHLTIIIMPALFKVSYVVRLASLKDLGLNE